MEAAQRSQQFIAALAENRPVHARTHILLSKIFQRTHPKFSVADDDVFLVSDVTVYMFSFSTIQPRYLVHICIKDHIDT
jgi:hypothetical protein